MTVSADDVRRLLSMIDESPAQAKQKLTVHELRIVADVLRAWLRERDETVQTEEG